MLSADEVRKNMPAYKPATKDEFLADIEKRAVAAAREGATSIWVTWKDGFRENPTAAFDQALNVLRDKGYRLVEDSYKNKPAIRIYWEDEPAKSEWEIKNLPRTAKQLTMHVLSNAVMGAVFFGFVAYVIVLILNELNESNIDIYDATGRYATIGFFVVGFFAWLVDSGVDVRTKKEES